MRLLSHLRLAPLSELGGELKTRSRAADRIAQLLAQPLRRADPAHPKQLYSDGGVQIRFSEVEFGFIIAVFPLRR